MATKKGDRRPATGKAPPVGKKKKSPNPQPGKLTAPEVRAQERFEKLAQAEGSSATETRQQSSQRLAALTPFSAAAKFDTRTFILGCVVAAALAVAGYYWLSSIQVPVSEAFSTSAVRLD